MTIIYWPISYPHKPHHYYPPFHLDFEPLPHTQPAAESVQNSPQVQQELARAHGQV
jgi:hypothetical protein